MSGKTKIPRYVGSAGFTNELGQKPVRSFLLIHRQNVIGQHQPGLRQV